MVADQFGAPTWARGVAEATGQMLAQIRSQGERAPAWLAERVGTYHITNGGRCSWYEFAGRILALYRGGEHAPGVHPIDSSAYPAVASRPGNSVLDCTLLRERFGLALEPWETALERVMEEIRERRSRREAATAGA